MSEIFEINERNKRVCPDFNINQHPCSGAQKDVYRIYALPLTAGNNCSHISHPLAWSDWNVFSSPNAGTALKDLFLLLTEATNDRLNGSPVFNKNVMECSNPEILSKAVSFAQSYPVRNTLMHSYYLSELRCRDTFVLPYTRHVQTVLEQGIVPAGQNNNANAYNIVANNINARNINSVNNSNNNSNNNNNNNSNNLHGLPAPGAQNNPGALNLNLRSPGPQSSSNGQQFFSPADIAGLRRATSEFTNSVNDPEVPTQHEKFNIYVVKCTRDGEYVGCVVFFFQYDPLWNMGEAIGNILSYNDVDESIARKEHRRYLEKRMKLFEANDVLHPINHWRIKDYYKATLALHLWRDDVSFDQQYADLNDEIERLASYGNLRFYQNQFHPIHAFDPAKCKEVFLRETGCNDGSLDWIDELVMGTHSYDEFRFSKPDAVWRYYMDHFNWCKSRRAGLFRERLPWSKPYVNAINYDEARHRNESNFDKLNRAMMRHSEREGHDIVQRCHIGEADRVKHVAEPLTHVSRDFADVIEAFNMACLNELANDFLRRRRISDEIGEALTENFASNAWNLSSTLPGTTAKVLQWYFSNVQLGNFSNPHHYGRRGAFNYIYYTPMDNESYDEFGVFIQRDYYLVHQASHLTGELLNKLMKIYMVAMDAARPDKTLHLIAILVGQHETGKSLVTEILTNKLLIPQTPTCVTTESKRARAVDISRAGEIIVYHEALPYMVERPKRGDTAMSEQVAQFKTTITECAIYHDVFVVNNSNNRSERDNIRRSRVVETPHTAARIIATDRIVNPDDALQSRMTFMYFWNNQAKEAQPGSERVRTFCGLGQNVHATRATWKIVSQTFQLRHYLTTMVQQLTNFDIPLQITTLASEFVYETVMSAMTRACRVRFFMRYRISEMMFVMARIFTIWNALNLTYMFKDSPRSIARRIADGECPMEKLDPREIVHVKPFLHDTLQIGVFAFTHAFRNCYNPEFYTVLRLLTRIAKLDVSDVGVDDRDDKILYRNRSRAANWRRHITREYGIRRSEASEMAGNPASGSGNMIHDAEIDIKQVRIHGSLLHVAHLVSVESGGELGMTTAMTILKQIMNLKIALSRASTPVSAHDFYFLTTELDQNAEIDPEASSPFYPTGHENAPTTDYPILEYDDDTHNLFFTWKAATEDVWKKLFEVMEAELNYRGLAESRDLATAVIDGTKPGQTTLKSVRLDKDKATRTSLWIPNRYYVAPTSRKHVQRYISGNARKCDPGRWETSAEMVRWFEGSQATKTISGDLDLHVHMKHCHALNLTEDEAREHWKTIKLIRAHLKNPPEYMDIENDV